MLETRGLSVRFGGQIPEFDPKLYVRPRKSLKVMSRESQIGFAVSGIGAVAVEAMFSEDRSDLQTEVNWLFLCSNQVRQAKSDSNHRPLEPKCASVG